MPKVDAATAAKRWAEGASAASSRYTEGVMSVKTAPGQAAAAKVQKYQLGVQNNVAKWQARTAAVTLGAWQQAVSEKGASRYSQGVSQAEGKMAAFTTQFFPFLAGVEQQLKAMPDTTLEQRAEKAKQAALMIAKFQRR